MWLYGGVGECPGVGMRNQFDAMPPLKAALQRHFEGLSDQDAETYAREIWSGTSVAWSLQVFERNDLKPSDDVDSLRKAAAAIDVAHKHMIALGLHGGSAARGLAQEIHRGLNEINWDVNLGAIGSRDVIATHLCALAGRLRDAATKIDEQAAPYMSALGSDRPAGRPRGRPAETQKEFCAREVRDAFKKITGSNPKLLLDRVTGVAGGPFLLLLMDVFEALEIPANAEHFARKVCR